MVGGIWNLWLYMVWQIGCIRFSIPVVRGYDNDRCLRCMIVT
jgi:hypothetical protein